MKELMGGVDYVFHLAAEARIQPAILNPIEAVLALTVLVLLQSFRSLESVE